MNGQKYLLSFTDKLLFYSYDLMLNSYKNYNNSEFFKLKESLNNEFIKKNQKIIDAYVVSNDTIKLKIDNSNEYNYLLQLIFENIEDKKNSNIKSNIVTLNIENGDSEEIDSENEKINNDGKKKSISSDEIIRIFHKYLMKRLNVNKNNATATTSTYFFGKSSNLNEHVLKNYNNHLFIGYSGIIGIDISPYISKSFNSNIMSRDLYFIHKNNVYSNYLTGCLIKLSNNDYFSYEDGVFGWGEEFYHHDVLLKPHKNVIIDMNIVIDSPLVYDQD